jgi:hypothetical protein
VFSLSDALPARKPLGIIYIWFLGQPESVSEKIRRNGRSMAKRGHVAPPS